MTWSLVLSAYATPLRTGPKGHVARALLRPGIRCGRGAGRTPLATDYSVAGLLRYGFLFLLIWWAWNGHSTFSTRFDTDDVVQRVLTLVQIFVVAVMAVNAKDALDSRSSAGFAAAYA